MTRSQIILSAIAAAALAAAAAIALLSEKGAPPSEMVTPALSDEWGTSGAPSPSEALEALGERDEPQRATASRHTAPKIDAEPGDLTGLAPLRVRVIDKLSGQPLYKTLCLVSDENNVAVEAMTDSEGILAPDEWLMKGKISLFYLHPSAKSPVARRGEHFEFVHGPFHHGGLGETLDDWEGVFERYIGLEVAGDVIPENEIYVTLASSGGSRQHVAVNEMTLRHRRKDTGSAFQEVEMLAFSTGRSAAKTFRDWSRAKMGLHIPGRRLRAVTIHQGAVYEAEVAMATIPHWQDGAIPLVFAPMTATHPDIIRARYSDRGADHVLRHLRAKKRSEDLAAMGVAPITGVVTSTTGTFHGKTWAIARPKMARAPGETPFPTEKDLVKWTENEDGQWVGRFELLKLAPARYVVEIRPKTGSYVIPRYHEAQAPHEFQSGVLVVADHIEAAPVRITVPAFASESYHAKLEFEFAERASESSLWVPTRPKVAPGDPIVAEYYTFPVEVPVGGVFTVSVGKGSQKARTFTASDFVFADGAYVGTLRMD